MSGIVLVIDDQPEVGQLLSELLAERGRETVLLQDGDRALAWLAEHPDEADLVILDLDLGPGRRDGLSVLPDIKQAFADLPVVILTGKGTVDEAVRAMQLGATDFVAKDTRLGARIALQMDKLERMLAVAHDNRRLRQENRLLKEQAGMAQSMVGAEGGLAQIMAQIRALADIPRPVLILGERGTGKELVAAALHEHSRRKDAPFVTVNCAALPEGLAEAELFGAAKGAYTDAREGRPGKFELADGGSLFLDEVGNMPMALQQKILRVLEYQRFERVGSGVELAVDVRITAATNADLEAEMLAGRFRRDLFDRLAFDTIHVPPLRERRQDIPNLAKHFIERFRGEVAGLTCEGIDDDALASLQKLPLQGNVRELKHLVERAAYRCQTKNIEAKDLQLGPLPGPKPAMEGDFQEQVMTFEQDLLRKAMKGRNIKEAAKTLNLGYDQMRRLMKKHAIKTP